MKDYQERLNDLVQRSKKLEEDIMETLTPAPPQADGLARAMLRQGDVTRELECVRDGRTPWMD